MNLMSKAEVVSISVTLHCTPKDRLTLTCKPAFKTESRMTPVQEQNAPSTLED